jgi:RimJ/RimL family protein N-acetyltransferase
MQFETERFLIRPLTAMDAAPHICEWTLDSLGAEMLNVPQRPWAIEQQRKFFASAAQGSKQVLLGIWAKDIHKLIGFFQIDPHPKNQAFTMTTLIGEAAWRGHNVIAEASDLVQGHFFDTLGFVKAKANVRPHNKAVLWIMANGGWRKEAHLVKHLRASSSAERMDVLVLGLLADDWKRSVAVRRRRAADHKQAGRITHHVR